jgi:hypothetical protein
VAEESAREAFDRGHTAGEIAEQLRRHEDHLAKINGSTEKTAQALVALGETQQQMALQLQRLADQAASDARTRVATATALKDADEARRNLDDQRWSPFARVFAVVAGLAAATSVAAWVWAQIN